MDVCHVAFVALYSALPGFTCTQLERAPETYWKHIGHPCFGH